MELLGFGASVTVTAATTPPPIGLVFVPVARHFTDPAVETQERIFRAFVRADPATLLTAVISPAGYAIVHCRPAGALPVNASERFKETDPPGNADPELRLKDVV
jgi:hypothetical protein